MALFGLGRHSEAILAVDTGLAHNPGSENLLEARELIESQQKRLQSHGNATTAPPAASVTAVSLDAVLSTLRKAGAAFR
jgi:hypothetical protein